MGAPIVCDGNANANGAGPLDAPGHAAGKPLASRKPDAVRRGLLRLSGYRNVLLGGLAMGLSRTEVDDQMDEIVEFSGLAKAMERPMNTYSSGMRARLAFSIATLRIPDILLIDEALAVGDKDFREKCLQRVREIQQAAGTVIMVTHNLNEMRETCSRTISLDQGVLQADGAVNDVIDAYGAR